ncbi:MAG: IS66 family transposase [bacterium]|nr:IS66 family transposase [bacterium]
MSYSHFPATKVQHCHFSKSCPHLNGESTFKVLAERNYLRERVNQMQNLFGFAEREITKLKEQVGQLTQEKKSLEEDLTQAQQAPFKKFYSKRNSSGDTPKKRGAPFGHPGASRKNPETIDEYVAVPLKKCPVCGNSKLSICKDTDEHVQQDIVIKKVITRSFVHFHYWCPHCKKVVSGVAENEIPKAPIGPVAKAVAGFLRYQTKISYDDIQHILQNLFGLEITPGAIVGFDNKIYRKGLSLYEALKKMLPYTSSIYADETGWKKKWLWTFSNEQLIFFHIDPHRSGDVVKEHLGSNYKGILSSDFYSAYNSSINAFAKQKCNAHLLRAVKDLEEKFPEETEVISFCNNLKKLIQDAILLLSQHDKLPPEKWKSSKKNIFRRFKSLYKIPISHPKAETLRKRLLKHNDEILTFLKYPKVVKPTNNIAERSLRNLVIFRKITFGNRSDQGTKNVSLISTIIQTAKLKGLDPKQVLMTLLTKGLTPELFRQFDLPQTRSP